MNFKKYNKNIGHFAQQQDTEGIVGNIFQLNGIVIVFVISHHVMNSSIQRSRPVNCEPCHFTLLLQCSHSRMNMFYIFCMVVFGCTVPNRFWNRKENRHLQDQNLITFRLRVHLQTLAFIPVRYFPVIQKGFYSGSICGWDAL